MKFAKWIALNGLKKQWVAEKIGVHPGHMSRYMSGKAVPSLARMVRIEELTKGEVRASDFFEPRTPPTKKEKAA